MAGQVLHSANTVLRVDPPAAPDLVSGRNTGPVKASSTPGRKVPAVEASALRTSSCLIETRIQMHLRR